MIYGIEIALLAFSICVLIGCCAYIYFQTMKEFDIFENPECRKKSNGEEEGK